LGTQHDLMEKSGSWYSYKGEKIGQGKENVRIYLKNHPEIAKVLEQQLLEKLLPKNEKKEKEEEEDKNESAKPKAATNSTAKKAAAKKS